MEKISWNNPTFGDKEIELVTEVLKSGYVSEGPKTKELEERLGKIVNAKHVIMTTSATAALYLAIEADKRIRNYTEGEVIIPNLTFIATRNAVEMANLSPRICEVNENNFMLHKDKKEHTEKTKIVIPVNLLGRSYSTYEASIWSDNGVLSTIICDNAGCLGSNVPNGKVGCYSLQANKLLTCGQGGFCATDDDEYAKVIRQLKDFGREDKEDQHTKGFNFKFNDIQAAVALGQLDRFENRKEMHLHQYYRYKDSLGMFGKFVEYQPGEIPLWIEFFTDRRDELYDYLRERGIESRKPWAQLVDNPELYPNTDYYTKNCLWLPNGASLTIEQQEEVIEAVQDFYSSYNIKIEQPTARDNVG